jgi:hypothetical protein
MYGFRVRTWRTTTPPPIVGPTDFMRVLRKKREKRKMCFHVFTFPILGERYRMGIEVLPLIQGSFIPAIIYVLDGRYL